MADGVREFYITSTGQKFVPRAINYLDFLEDLSSGREDVSGGL